MLLDLHKKVNKEHLLPNHPFRLVVSLPRAVRAQPLADRNLWQANILHHGPDDGQARRLGREGINLIGALPHIAKQARSGIGAAKRAMHDRREGREGKSNVLRLRRDYEQLLDSASDTWRFSAARFKRASSFFSCCQIPLSSVITSCCSRLARALSTFRCLWTKHR
jgi:hypothetical protein